MNVPLAIGLILIVGLSLGKLLSKIGLPRVTGYIVAGLVLNPSVIPAITRHFVASTGILTTICLGFITFEVGGELSVKKMESLGIGIVGVAFFEAFGAFFAVLAGFLLLVKFNLLSGAVAGTAGVMVAFAILASSLASPTDPSASLAVSHEYHASGPVTRTILGASAFDDAIGILIFSLSVEIAKLYACSGGATVSIESVLKTAAFAIFGAIAIGMFSGMILNLFSSNQKQNDGRLIVMILGVQALCLGISTYVGVDELLSTMALGATVVNLNKNSEHIFDLLSEYTEQLVFVIFFVLSAMHFQFSGIVALIPLVGAFVLFRTIGKLTGVALGAKIFKMPPVIGKWTGLGLIPQGGIVLGLALGVQKIPAFANFGTPLIGLVMGGVIIHEVCGPFLAKFALSHAKELPENK